jgi:hypothetical protein
MTPQQPLLILTFLVFSATLFQCPLAISMRGPGDRRLEIDEARARLAGLKEREAELALRVKQDETELPEKIVLAPSGPGSPSSSSDYFSPMAARPLETVHMTPRQSRDLARGADLSGRAQSNGRVEAARMAQEAMAKEAKANSAPASASGSSPSSGGSVVDRDRALVQQDRESREKIQSRLGSDLTRKSEALARGEQYKQKARGELQVAKTDTADAERKEKVAEMDQAKERKFEKLAEKAGGREVEERAKEEKAKMDLGRAEAVAADAADRERAMLRNEKAAKKRESEDAGKVSQHEMLEGKFRDAATAERAEQENEISKYAENRKEAHTQIREERAADAEKNHQFNRVSEEYDWVKVYNARRTTFEKGNTQVQKTFDTMEKVSLALEKATDKVKVQEFKTYAPAPKAALKAAWQSMYKVDRKQRKETMVVKKGQGEVQAYAAFFEAKQKRAEALAAKHLQSANVDFAKARSSARNAIRAWGKARDEASKAEEVGEHAELDEARESREKQDVGQWKSAEALDKDRVQRREKDAKKFEKIELAAKDAEAKAQGKMERAHAKADEDKAAKIAETAQAIKAGNRAGVEERRAADDGINAKKEEAYAEQDLARAAAAASKSRLYGEAAQKDRQSSAAVAAKEAKDRSKLVRDEVGLEKSREKRQADAQTRQALSEEASKFTAQESVPSIKSLRFDTDEGPRSRVVRILEEPKQGASAVAAPPPRGPAPNQVVEADLYVQKRMAHQAELAKTQRQIIRERAVLEQLADGGQ